MKMAFGVLTMKLPYIISQFWKNGSLCNGYSAVEKGSSPIAARYYIFASFFVSHLRPG